MTIEEYKTKFIDLFNEMQNEHGIADGVEISRIRYDFCADSIVCRITF